MSMTFYAAKFDEPTKCFSPAFGDIEEKMSVSNASAHYFLGELDLSMNDGDSFHCEIEPFVSACVKFLTKERGNNAYFYARVMDMIEEVREGVQHGATHFVVA